MDEQLIRPLALELPGALEQDHFGKPAFSVKKKIFCTWWVHEERAVIKLTPEQQAEWCAELPDAFAPLPNKWGQHGWTNVYLPVVNERTMRHILDRAWRNVCPKWLLPTRQVPPKG
ncbi:MAG: MmcQ/YjbR family DNA-binding protein [Flavobacteriales bacterium]|jgi:hypothetical protein